MATIRKTATREVTLTYTNDFGHEISRTFWIGMNGGAIREGERQICEGLGYRGATLTADDEADLLATIRREWKARRKAA